MAKRRSIGAGLGRASTRIGDLIDMLLKNQLQEQSQAKQAGYVASRQRELAELQHSQQMERLGFQANQQQGTEKRVGLRDIAGDIQSASNMTNLPTFQDVNTRAGQFGEDQMDIKAMPLPRTGMGSPMAMPTGSVGSPAIQDLMKQRQTREQAIKAELGIQEQGKEQILPGGNKGFIGRDGSPIATERTAQQQAERDKAIKLGSDLDIETIMAETARAGEVAEATARGSTRGQIETRYELRDKLLDVERALTQARATGKPNPAANSEVQQIANQMVTLATKLNVSGTAASARGRKITGGIARSTGIDIDPATDYDQNTIRDLSTLESLRQGTTSLFARLLGHVGVLTDKDEERVRRLLPDIGLTQDENRVRNANFLMAFRLAQQYGDDLSGLSPEGQSVILNQRLDQIEAALSGGRGGGQTPGGTLDAASILGVRPPGGGN